MKNKTIYTKPDIKTLNMEAGTLLASSGGISAEGPDFPWATESTESSDISADIDPIPFTSKRILTDKLNDNLTDN